jgi:alpha-galactosidase
MLEVGNGGMTEDEYRTHMSLWAMLAAPLIAGNDLRSMSPATRETLTNPEVIAIDQDPLGRQGKPAWKSAETEVWARPLQDAAYAVALFNRGTEARSITARWADLGLAGPYMARDLWSHESRGRLEGELTASVAPHAVALFRLTKESQPPH